VQTPIRPQRFVLGLLWQAVDAIAVVGSLWAVTRAAGRPFDEEMLNLALIGVLVFLVAGRMTGLDRRWARGGMSHEIVAIGGAWLATVFVLLAIGFAFRTGEAYPRGTVLAWAAVAPILVAGSGLLLRVARRLARLKGIGVRRVAIAGYNHLGHQVAIGLAGEADGSGLRVVGFFDDRGGDRLPDALMALPGLQGKLSDLVAACRNRDLDMVLITLPMRAEARIRKLLDELSDTTASVYLVPDIFVFELLHSRWGTLGGLPAISLFESPFYGVDGTLKRSADLILAGLAIALAAIPMAFIALLVRLSGPGPVLFKQRRYGLDGREFRVWKFRTMRVCEDGTAVRQASRSDDRVTPLGRVLRRTSLDELPQLFNVLGGTMSLVGPRPHATAHNEDYRRRIHGYMLRHKVKPGVTGLAQVEGCRGETETLDKMKRRVDYDLRYIRDWSLMLDFQILAKTLIVAWRQPQAF
jgi:putative colanic acid biosynthesis UDP-glucose lipid carrier transferase